jgi:hypothetical protein
MKIPNKMMQKAQGIVIELNADDTLRREVMMMLKDTKELNFRSQSSYIQKSAVGEEFAKGLPQGG